MGFVFLESWIKAFWMRGLLLMEDNTKGLKFMKRILIVDDDVTVIKVLTERLSVLADYKIMGATSGREALELVEVEAPCLVVLDVVLPDIMGFDVCRAIKEAHPEIKVIIYTGELDAMDTHKATQMRADDFVVKNQEFIYIFEACMRSLGLHNI